MARPSSKRAYPSFDDYQAHESFQNNDSIPDRNSTRPLDNRVSGGRDIITDQCPQQTPTLIHKRPRHSYQEVHSVQGPVGCLSINQKNQEVYSYDEVPNLTLFNNNGSVNGTIDRYNHGTQDLVAQAIENPALQGPIESPLDYSILKTSQSSGPIGNYVGRDLNPKHYFESQVPGSSRGLICNAPSFGMVTQPGASSACSLTQRICGFDRIHLNRPDEMIEAPMTTTDNTMNVGFSSVFRADWPINRNRFDSSDRFLSINQASSDLNSMVRNRMISGGHANISSYQSSGNMNELSQASSQYLIDHFDYMNRRQNSRDQVAGGIYMNWMNFVLSITQSNRLNLLTNTTISDNQTSQYNISTNISNEKLILDGQMPASFSRARYSESDVIVSSSLVESRSGEASSRNLSDEKFLNAAQPRVMIRIDHKCFGKAKGLYYPDLLADQDSLCIECADCGLMLTPRNFLVHAHGRRELHVCHWGFNSYDWKHYIRMSKEQNCDLTTLKLFKAFRSKCLGILGSPMMQSRRFVCPESLSSMDYQYQTKPLAIGDTTRWRSNKLDMIDSDPFKPEYVTIEGTKFPCLSSTGEAMIYLPQFIAQLVKIFNMRKIIEKFEDKLVEFVPVTLEQAEAFNLSRAGIMFANFNYMIRRSDADLVCLDLHHDALQESQGFRLVRDRAVKLTGSRMRIFGSYFAANQDHIQQTHRGASQENSFGCPNTYDYKGHHRTTTRDLLHPHRFYHGPQISAENSRPMDPGAYISGMALERISPNRQT